MNKEDANVVLTAFCNHVQQAERVFRLVLDECERLRAERDARVPISPEDAAEAAGALGAEWEFVPFAVRQRIDAAFYAHAEKARKP